MFCFENKFKSDFLGHLVPIIEMLESKNLEILWGTSPSGRFLQVVGCEDDLTRTEWLVELGSATLLTCFVRLLRYLTPSHTREREFLHLRRKTVQSTLYEGAPWPRRCRTLGSLLCPPSQTSFSITLSWWMMHSVSSAAHVESLVVIWDSCSPVPSMESSSIALPTWPLICFQLLHSTYHDCHCPEGTLSDSFLTHSCTNCLSGLRSSTQQQRSNIEVSPFLKVSRDLCGWDGGSHWIGEVFQNHL